MILHGSCTAWFCMSCFSSAVPSRLASVLRCMSVRTSMLCRLPPFSFRAPFPFLFLAPHSCPVRQPCFRCPAGPASVPLAPCAAPRLLLPLVFCRQAYGPCLSSSFHLAPFALASPAPAQHRFLHSSWLSSVLATLPATRIRPTEMPLLR